jgi:hypothetical protein
MSFAKKPRSRVCLFRVADVSLDGKKAFMAKYKKMGMAMLAATCGWIVLRNGAQPCAPFLSD